MGSRVAAGVVGALLVAGAVLLLVVIVDGSNGPPGPSSAVTVVGDDFSFDPDTIEGIAGELEVTLKNEGKVGHELVVLKEGVHIAARPQFDEAMSLGRIRSIAPDDELTQVFDLEGGAYQIVCLLPGHLEAGMTAELIVQ